MHKDNVVIFITNNKVIFSDANWWEPFKTCIITTFFVHADTEFQIILSLLTVLIVTNDRADDHVMWIIELTSTYSLCRGEGTWYLPDPRPRHRSLVRLTNRKQKRASASWNIFVGSVFILFLWSIFFSKLTAYCQISKPYAHFSFWKTNENTSNFQTMFFSDCTYLLPILW